MTLASFLRECILKIGKTELELLTDVDMILDQETAIRQGITRDICRYVEASNKSMLDYDKTKESSHNEYLGYNYQYNELYHNQFPMANLDMLKISQSLHMILLKTTTKKVIWLYINI